MSNNKIISKLKQLKLSHAANYYEAQYLTPNTPQIGTAQLIDGMWSMRLINDIIIMSIN